MVVLQPARREVEALVHGFVALILGVRRVAWIGAGVLAVAAVAAVVVVLSGGSASVGERCAPPAAPTATRAVPAEEPPRSPTPRRRPDARGEGSLERLPASGGSALPGSGRRGASTPEPVNPRMVVHNEEHGGVVLWWGPKVPPATVASSAVSASPSRCSGRRCRARRPASRSAPGRPTPRTRATPGLAYRNGSSASAGSPSARASTSTRSGVPRCLPRAQPAGLPARRRRAGLRAYVGV